MCRSLLVGQIAAAMVLLVPRPGAGQGILVCADAIQPQVAVDGTGKVYVAFLHRGNICVSRSDDKGKTFGGPMIAIDAKGTARGGRQRGPRIGVDGLGNVVVTAFVSFDRAELAKRYPAFDLFMARSEDLGATWSRPTQLNSKTGMAPEGLHALVVTDSGKAYAAWLDIRGRTQPGQNIHYSAIVAGHAVFDTKVAEGVCECCAPGMALTSAGLPVLAYREGGERESRELFFQRHSKGSTGFEAKGRINVRDSMEFG